MALQETTLSQALAKVGFVIDRQGKTQGVFLPLATWEKVLEALEDSEDLAIVRNYMTRRTKAYSLKEMGLLNWEDVEDEWANDER